MGDRQASLCPDRLGQITFFPEFAGFFYASTLVSVRYVPIVQVEGHVDRRGLEGRPDTAFRSPPPVNPP